MEGATEFCGALGLSNHCFTGGKPVTLTADEDDTIETSTKKNDSEIDTKIQDIKDESQKLWVDVLNENRNPKKGLVMEYVPPARVEGEFDIEIEEEDVASEIQFWENTLIMYGLGEDLIMTAVKNFMAKVWNFVTLPDLYYHEEGYFLLRFKNHDDMDAVMMKGSYTIRNRPMILKEWHPDYNVMEDMLRTLPIWVTLPLLPLRLWGARSLNKIGSLIGVPLVTDECTAHKLRVSYARILVEVDITRKLMDEFTIKDLDGKMIRQKIEYEWRSKFCEKCQKVGHKCGEEVKRKIWKPKPQQREPILENTQTTPKEDKIHVVEETDWTVVN